MTLETPASKLVARRLADLDVLDLASVATLFLIVLNSGRSTVLLAAALIVCVIGVFSGRARQSAWFWFAISGGVALANLRDWYLIDNHKYLLNYWCLAMGVAHLSNDPKKILRLNARVIVGLVFLLATLWKLASTEYLSGGFFHYHLLLDTRFELVARFVGGLSAESIAANQQLVGNMVRGSGAPLVSLHDAVRLRSIALVFTWWGLIVEALLAVAFLVPIKRLTARWRNYLLWLFAMTVYPVVPVIGFGGQLMLMGLLQSDEEDSFSRRVYVGLLLVTPFYSLLWNGLRQMI